MSGNSLTLIRSHRNPLRFTTNRDKMVVFTGWFLTEYCALSSMMSFNHAPLSLVREVIRAQESGETGATKGAPFG